MLSCSSSPSAFPWNPRTWEDTIWKPVCSVISRVPSIQPSHSVILKVYLCPRHFLELNNKASFRQSLGLGIIRIITKISFSRSSTKRTANRAAKTGKAETSKTVGPSKSLHSEAQDWVCDKIIDITGEIESPKSSIPPDSRKHHLKGPMASCLSHQPPIDNKKTSKSVSALSGKASSHLHFM